MSTPVCPNSEAENCSRTLGSPSFRSTKHQIRIVTTGSGIQLKRGSERVTIEQMQHHKNQQCVPVRSQHPSSSHLHRPIQKVFYPSEPLKQVNGSDEGCCLLP
mmetsp:Transcript_14046/g.21276  ORF Transcript_14046/g.21276 Transcript_14046/m.21276 type:complete len:103 (+) Transcript_14046:1445-1753(+)